MTARQQIKMTPEEVERFLAGHRRAAFATLHPDGSVHLVPVHYVVLDGDVAFWADPASQKVVDLRRDPRVSVLVEDGDGFEELRGVHLRGRALLIEDGRRSAEMVTAMAARQSGPASQTEVRRLEGLAAQRAVVLVDAHHVVSWDHAKLAGATALEVGR